MNFTANLDMLQKFVMEGTFSETENHKHQSLHPMLLKLFIVNVSEWQDSKTTTCR